MRIENSYNPLSDDELEEVLIEIRSNNGGSNDPLFVFEGGDNHKKAKHGTQMIPIS